MTDSKELIAELRGKKWMVNCEMRGLIPDDTAERATAHIAAQDACIEVLEGALREPVNLCESKEAAAIRFIDILRSDIAASVTILTDNEEADTIDTQRAIEVQAEWANAEWEPVRFYGETVLQALAKAVCARKAALGGEQHGG